MPEATEPRGPASARRDHDGASTGGAAEVTVPAARTALVTGASRGIGREIALGLARDGIDVALLARDERRLAAVADEVRGLGRSAVVLGCDVTSAPEVRSAVEQAESSPDDGGLGSIDLLVNNAGRIESETPLWEADPEDWWATFEANVRGVFLLNRYVVPGMLARGGGRVVDLASGASTHESPAANSAYNASKTALLRMGSALHAEGYGHGLRVFELAPGTVRTDMSTSMTIHANRTDWTAPERVTDLVGAMAAGRLDVCSGWLVRATHDTPDSLRELAVRSAEQGTTAPRRLRVLPASIEDPLTETLIGR